jgi:hypothetical protein
MIKSLKGVCVKLNLLQLSIKFRDYPLPLISIKRMNNCFQIVELVFKSSEILATQIKLDNSTKVYFDYRMELKAVKCHFGLSYLNPLKALLTYIRNVTLSTKNQNKKAKPRRNSIVKRNYNYTQFQDAIKGLELNQLNKLSTDN